MRNMACWPALLLFVTGASALTFEESAVVLPGVRRSTHERISREGILFPDDPRLSPDYIPEEPALLPPEPVPDNVLELPDDLNELPLTALEKMNSINSMEEFFALFDLEPPENAASRPTAPGFNSGFTIDGRFGVSNTVVAKMATCKPEETTVPLNLPEEPNTIYYPSCVRLPRCGGCCVGSQLECQPTGFNPIKLKVIKTVTRSGTNRRSAGRRRRRRTPTMYFEVEEQEHTACKCDCKVKESHCTPEVHIYSKNECSCLCKNKDEEKKCGNKNTTHLWDPKKCQCVCRKQQGCSTGQYFSQVSCSCEWPVSSRSGLRSTDFQPTDGFDDPRRAFTIRRSGGGRGHRRRPERVPVERGRRRPERVRITQPILF